MGDHHSVNGIKRQADVLNPMPIAFNILKKGIPCIQQNVPHKYCLQLEENTDHDIYHVTLFWPSVWILMLTPETLMDHSPFGFIVKDY